MKWVTRERPKTDRVACPWLIQKFIDPEAEIIYAPADRVLEVAQREGARSFDAPGAEFNRREGTCSFEVLIEDFDLAGDPALARLAKIVHAADIEGEIHTDPLAPGLLAIAEGRGTPRQTTTGSGARVVRLRRPLRMVPASSLRFFRLSVRTVPLPRMGGRTVSWATA
jgi:hypothetical protein